MADGVSELFNSPHETLQWGRESIAKLDSECRAFFKTAAHRFFIDVDANTGQHIQKFQFLDKVPRSVVRPVTESLIHIKHSFDQSLHGAIRAIRTGKIDAVYFPWTESLADLKGRLQKSKIPPELHPFLFKCEPYPSGNGSASDKDIVRALAQTANRKHTVNLSIQPNINMIELPSIAGTWKGPYPLRLNPSWDSVKQELEIFRYMPGSDVHNDAKIVTVVSFDEAFPLKELPVVGGLTLFLNKAEEVLTGLEREVRLLLGA